MSFAIYLVGYIIFILGLGLGAYYLHIPAHWIAVMVLVLIGLGIAGGVSRTRGKDPA